MLEQSKSSLIFEDGKASDFLLQERGQKDMGFSLGFKCPPALYPVPITTKRVPAVSREARGKQPVTATELIQLDGAF